MPDPMMVRLAVSSPDSPPLNSGSSQVISQSNNNTSSSANNSYVHQTDAVAQPSTTTPPVQASVSPTQQNSHQMAQTIPPGAIPLNQMSPHHMPPSFHHHPHSSGANGGAPHIHDHNNGHHHNGLYLGPAYANEYYPAGADPPHGAYFIPPELCPAHTQLCTVHPEYGKPRLSTEPQLNCVYSKILFSDLWKLTAQGVEQTPSFGGTQKICLEHHLTSTQEPLFPFVSHLLR